MSVIWGKLVRMAEKWSKWTRRPKVLVIAGSTSVGKTELSLELASQLRGEVVSADSAQVFRGMDIGSAKIRPDEMKGIPHHLLDVADIGSLFSAGEYASVALRVCEDIVSRGCVPLVVGGSGLYFRNLMEGPSGAPSSTVESRKRVDEMLAEDGGQWDLSVKRLAALDPVYAASLVTNDWYRLKRALDICMLSGRPVTSFKREYCPSESEYDFKCLFLTMPRVPLYQRIDLRCELIVQQGLFTEVIGLVKEAGLVADSQAGRSVGYRQALEFLDSVWGFPSTKPPYQLQVAPDQLRPLFIDFLHSYQAKTRQLATSQSTWIKKSPFFHWLNMAPGGNRLSASEVAAAVTDWFQNDTPLPQEWRGESLKDITSEELEELKHYEHKHTQLHIFSDPSQVNTVLEQIQTSIVSHHVPQNQQQNC